jgi:hypothetical protein
MSSMRVEEGKKKFKGFFWGHNINKVPRKLKIFLIDYLM